MARYRYRDTAGCQGYGGIQAVTGMIQVWNTGGVFQKYTPGEGLAAINLLTNN